MYQPRNCTLQIFIQLIKHGYENQLNGSKDIAIRPIWTNLGQTGTFLKK